MELRALGLAGLVEILPRRLGDERGYFAEVWREDCLASTMGDLRFVQENQSWSAKPGTVRGLHFQIPPAAQGKLVRCVAGAIWDVVVDIRTDSPTFGQWASVELTPEKLNQLWVPAGFAHGFCTLMPDTVVSYRVTGYYSPEHDRGLAWDDPAIAIIWPDGADAATLSAKDRAQPRLGDLPAWFSLKD